MSFPKGKDTKDEKVRTGDLNDVKFFPIYELNYSSKRIRKVWNYVSLYKYIL